MWEQHGAVEMDPMIQQEDINKLMNGSINTKL